MKFLAQDIPQKIALSHEEQNLSYAELEAEIKKMSLQLKKLPTGILVLQATHHPLFVIQLLAALNIGKPVALFSSQESNQQKRTILNTNMTINEEGNS